MNYTKIIHDGLWHNNPALVQVLGLCPLLAVSNSVVNALGLGLATLVVLTASNLVVSLIRHQIRNEIRLPVFVMIIATLATCIQFLMQAFTFELYEILGIFVPLIAANCIILARSEVFASKNPPLPSAIDGFMMGMGFLIVLLFLGALRELLGQGTVFANMELLLGENFSDAKIVVFENDTPFLFALLPPGAFIGLGLMIAGKNVIDAHYKTIKNIQKEPVMAGSKRVRTTGNIKA